VILGTTDTPRHDLAREPLAFEEEIDFILNESARYLTRGPKRSDVKSIWVGLRPLVKPPDEDGDSTKKLSREHTILVSRSGLVTVTGGKWTTYRAMAEDVLERCFERELLQRNAIEKGDETGSTSQMKLIGGEGAAGGSKHQSMSASPGLHSYGSEQTLLQSIDGADVVLTEGLSAAMVRFAVRFEYARTVEDVLARRSRLLFLDAKLAKSLASEVAVLMRKEGIVDPKLDAFNALADQYVCPLS
jgi:glycerol-3-phosphate dehydrogenase